MGVGAKSPLWRRALFTASRSLYFRRRCRTKYGTFQAYVSPNSVLRVLDFRQSLVQDVHHRFIEDWVAQDSVVWDIGANLGLFALPAALRAGQGRVYAFEPDTELAANLLRTLRLPANRNLHVSPLCLAISNADGAASFQVSKFSRAMSRLEGVAKWRNDAVQTQELRTVPTLRIDTLAKSVPPPSVLKIDVEGAEISVLEGGEETIAKHRPAILIESPKELWADLQRIFHKHDYVLLDGEAEHPTPVQEPQWDTVAVPREKYEARVGALAGNSAPGVH